MMRPMLLSIAFIVVAIVVVIIIIVPSTFRFAALNRVSAQLNIMARAIKSAKYANECKIEDTLIHMHITQ